MRRPIVPGHFTSASNRLVRQGRGARVLAPAPNNVLDGWTKFVPSADSRIIYISSSLGSDGYDGLSEASPKLTVSAGVALLRDGFPDHVRFKRGDTWTGENISIGDISGRSFSEMMVFEAYGDLNAVRPLFKTGTTSGIVLGFAQTEEFVAFTDLDFIAHQRDPNDPAFDNSIAFFDDQSGFDATSRGSYWHVEGCRFRYYATGLTIQNVDNPAQVVDNVTIKRTLALDGYVAGTGFSQGMYFSEVDNIIIDECTIDSIQFDEGSIFDHGAYFQNGSVGGNTIFRNNIVSRGDGIQMREGGTCFNNLFAKTWISIHLGGGNNATPIGVVATATQNVVLDGYNISPVDTRGWGFRVLNIDGYGSSVISDNIIANNTYGTFPRPFLIDSSSSFDNATVNKINNLTIERNITYNWGGVGFDLTGDAFTNLEISNNVVRSDEATEAWNNDTSTALADMTANSNRFWGSTNDASADIVVQAAATTYASWESQLSSGTGNSHIEVSYNDPARSLARYNSEVLLGAESFDSFITSVRDQRKGSWNNQLTAPIVNNWLRKGFVEQ